MASNTRIIGNGSGMPKWRLRSDLNFFKKITSGQSVITGRKGYMALPDSYRPLPDRKNIILTRDPSWLPENPDDDNIIVVHSIWEALEEAEKGPGDKIFCIGGGDIYNLFLEKVVLDEIYITMVLGDFEGSIKFPMLPFSLKSNYREQPSIEIKKEDGRNSHDAIIQTYLKNDQKFS